MCDSKRKEDGVGSLVRAGFVLSGGSAVGVRKFTLGYGSDCPGLNPHTRKSSEEIMGQSIVCSHQSPISLFLALHG